MCAASVDDDSSYPSGESVDMRMMNVLMVAQTPLLASTVANILSDGWSTSSKSLSPSSPVHRWCGLFLGNFVVFKMTSVCNQISKLDFDRKYKNWNNVKPEKLFSCPIVQKEICSDQKTKTMLIHEANTVDYLVLWFNNDEQSEKICSEIVETVQNHLASTDKFRRWRAKFSSLTPKDIKAAMDFDRIDIPRYNKALRINAREEINLRMRCAFTSFQTKYFHGKYNDLDTSLISYDLWGMSTLSFCVQRHDEIQNFKPQPYFDIQVTIQLKSGKCILLKWDKGKCLKRGTSSNFMQALKRQSTATVVSITKQEKTKLRPLPLNSVELMQAASAELKIGPVYALQLADKLYSQGYISYPRTESSCYSNDFDAFEIMDVLLRSPEYGKQMYKIIFDNSNKSRNGKHYSGQLPITPVKLALRNELDGDSWKIYDFILRRFVAAFSNDCKYYSNTVNFQIGKEHFMFNWNTLIDAGFTVITPKEALVTNKLKVNFNCEDKFCIQNIELIDKMTKPPSYLTESELVSIMEKNKIGIYSTIDSHIDFITQRNYVTVTTGRQLIPTDLGIVLVHGYQKIDKQLVEPCMCSSIEDQLSLIASGIANYDQVVDKIITAIQKKYFYFVKNINNMDLEFTCAFTSFSTTGKTFSRCGKCRRYMILILEKRPCLHCLKCNETYYLPTDGNFKINKELTCPLDNFELITWSSSKKDKNISLCPYCYNHPGFTDMELHSGCNQCFHPTCPEGFHMNGIASCFQCDDGTLVLDRLSRPKWKVKCNKCNVMFHLFEGAHKITIDKNEECECGAQLLKIEYKKERSRLPNGLLEMTGCLFCCDEFDSLIVGLNTRNSDPANNIRQVRKRTRMRNRRSHRVRRNAKARSSAKNNLVSLDAFFF